MNNQSIRDKFMGLDNKICKDPVYWCKSHKVWLSEKDVERKKCKSKPDFDLIGCSRCNWLERRKI